MRLFPWCNWIAQNPPKILERVQISLGTWKFVCHCAAEQQGRFISDPSLRFESFRWHRCCCLDICVAI